MQHNLSPPVALLTAPSITRLVLGRSRCGASGRWSVAGWSRWGRVSPPPTCCSPTPTVETPTVSLISRQVTTISISCFELCLQFSLWPNYEVVERPATLLALLARLDRLVEGGAGGETPVTVHCSGGVGRSGTFATVYSVHRLLANRSAEDCRLVVTSWCAGTRPDWLSWWMVTGRWCWSRW